MECAGLNKRGDPGLLPAGRERILRIRPDYLQQRCVRLNENLHTTITANVKVAVYAQHVSSTQRSSTPKA